LLLNHTVHGDEEADRLVREHYPQFADLYFGSFSPKLARAQKSDILRYMVLHHFGGWYADADVSAVRPLEGLRWAGDLVLAAEGLPKAEGSYRLCQYFMGARAGHPFFSHFLLPLVARRVSSLRTRAVRMHKENAVYWSTGPQALTDAYRAYAAIHLSDTKWDARVLPACTFGIWCPGRWWCEARNRRVYVRHHFDGSWKDGWQAEQASSLKLCAEPSNSTHRRGVS